jgi:hypothetical protein
MYDLLPEYIEKLELIAGNIQESNELQLYLEEEEETYYNQLKELYEPHINLVYEEVAANYPLQLIQLETILLNPLFEGLYLPRILGYSVLRGAINQNYKYVRPQDHFQTILETICNSANFDILKKRIGQTIQIGFALSSDIWVTNLLAKVTNKRVRNYLQGLKSDRLRVLKERQTAYARYERQFRNENFLSVTFPDTAAELTIEYTGLFRFLMYRIGHQENNASLYEPIDNFLAQEALIGTREHLQLAIIYGAFYADMPDASRKALATHFNAARKALPEADETVLEFLLELHANPDIALDPAADLRLAALVDRKIKDQLSAYYDLVETIHNGGYTNESTQEAIRAAYLNHEGLSNFNEGVRRTIFHYFARFVDNLEEEEYPEFFEITKLFAVYMGLFDNQKFNQDLKDLSMRYVRKLLKRYTDKRGKDYQDIKKFVSATFLDFNFLTEKEIVNLFKTRRKKRKPTEA